MSPKMENPIVCPLKLRGPELKRYEQIRRMRRKIDPGGGIAVTLSGGVRRGHMVRNKPAPIVEREYKSPVFYYYLFSMKGTPIMTDEPNVITLSNCRACRTGTGKLKSFPNMPGQKVYVIQCEKCGAASEPEISPEEAAKTWNWRPGMEE